MAGELTPSLRPEEADTTSQSGPPESVDVEAVQSKAPAPLLSTVND